MANEDAWDSGWNIGKSFARKKMYGSGGGKGVGQITTSDGQTLTPSKPLNYKTGGLVRKTGIAKLHKGEYVLTAAQAKHISHKTHRKTGARKRTQSKG